jgi:hypothetical protein
VEIGPAEIPKILIEIYFISIIFLFWRNNLREEEDISEKKWFGLR